MSEQDETPATPPPSGEPVAGVPQPEPPPDELGSVPPPVGAPPPGAAPVPLPPPDLSESPRDRRNREREELKLARAAEKQRRREERQAQKRQRAEEKAARKMGGMAPEAVAAADPPAVPEPEVSPADEATGLASPPPTPGAADAGPDAPTDETPVTPPPVEGGRKAKREQKKQERERARAERRMAVEQRRRERAAAKAAKQGKEVQVPPSDDQAAPLLDAPAPQPGTGVDAAPPEPASGEEALPAEDEPRDAALGIAAAVAAAEAESDTAGEPDPSVRLLDAEQREDDALVKAETQQAEADAERRIREIEQIRLAAESHVVEAKFADETRDRAGLTESEPGHPIENELRLSDQQIARRRRRDQELAEELEQAESRIEANRQRIEQAMIDARERLEVIEAQASEAEERASRAERLAELRQQEAERERRLHEMLGRINEAERQARDAEARARQAVAGVSLPLDPGTSPPEFLPPEPDPEPLSRLAQSASSAFTPPIAAPSPPSGAPDELDDSERVQNVELDETPAEPDESEPDEEETGSEEGAEADFGEVDDVTAGPAFGSGEPIDVNEATFEQLRNAGLSVTQTGRVLAHRERSGGFRSIDELDAIPGFPQEFLDRVKPNLTA